MRVKGAISLTECLLDGGLVFTACLSVQSVKAMAGILFVTLNCLLNSAELDGEELMRSKRRAILVGLFVAVLGACTAVGLWSQQKTAGAHVQDMRPQNNIPGYHKEDCYGFEVEKLSVDHQGKNVIRITVLYRYASWLKTVDYMDVTQLRNDVLKTVRTYPNKTDYWEVYAAHIADSLVKRYSGRIDTLRLKLEIAPTPDLPFARTSLVIRSRPGATPIIP